MVKKNDWGASIALAVIPAQADTFVIPAQAGIQWFRQYIPAQAGMTIRSAAPKVALAILIAGG